MELRSKSNYEHSDDKTCIGKLIAMPTLVKKVTLTAKTLLKLQISAPVVLNCT